MRISYASLRSYANLINLGISHFRPVKFRCKCIPQSTLTCQLICFIDVVNELLCICWKSLSFKVTSYAEKDD